VVATDSVAQLRGRWTPSLTEAAVAFLLGNPAASQLPIMELDGRSYLDLRGIRIEQVQFDGVLLQRVNLRWATFRDVGFKGARFLECNLSQANFAECYFRRAAFEACDIVNARFSACDFSNGRIDHCRLDFSTFATCELQLRDIVFRDDAPPQTLARVCRNLKLNAMSLGHFGDASELAYAERNYEREVLRQRALAPGVAPLARLRALALWSDAVLFNWIWGYGERPWRLTIAMLAMILGFGTLQYALDAVPGHDWWEHVYFSGITFLTIGYGDLTPIGFLPRLVSVIEGVAGILFIGMLIASATKKIMYR
jgi:hypothetical protein